MFDDLEVQIIEYLLKRVKELEEDLAFHKEMLLEQDELISHTPLPDTVPLPYKPAPGTWDPYRFDHPTITCDSCGCEGTI